MDMRCLCYLVVMGALALTAAPASAATPAPVPGCVSRPDVAVLDQYCPTLPGADGRGTDHGSHLSDVLPEKVVDRFREAGPLGMTLLSVRLAAPATKLAHKSRSRGLDAEDLLRRGTIGRVRTEPPANPLEVAAAAVGGNELSVAFGSLLLMSTFGISAAGWHRFRRRPQF